MLVVNRMIKGLVYFAYNSEGSCETSGASQGGSGIYSYWLASPANLVKPGHLLCCGIGRAGRIFPGSPVQARLFALLGYWPG